MPLLSIIQFGLNAGIVGIMTIGGIMIKNMVDIDPEKAIDFSTNIYGLVQTLVMVLSSAVGAVGVIVNSVRALPSFQRCNELVDINSSIKEVKKPKNINEKYDIEFNNVSFKYADEAKAYVLKNINFSLKEGETLGIIGPTGSGKSTLINLIPRLYDVNEGTVKIGGVDVKELKIDDIRDKIRVALQELILFSGDIQYNLRYGKRDASIEEMKQACEQSCA
ncbi:MAG: ABC transporter ATP-binding protein [Clostridia bacterium]|nr:ABC transporter ATP-binding protein [Clostridia bacterium]